MDSGCCRGRCQTLIWQRETAGSGARSRLAHLLLLTAAISLIPAARRCWVSCSEGLRQWRSLTLAGISVVPLAAASSGCSLSLLIRSFPGDGALSEGGRLQSPISQDAGRVERKISARLFIARRRLQLVLFSFLISSRFSQKSRRSLLFRLLPGLIYQLASRLATRRLRLPSPSEGEKGRENVNNELSSFAPSLVSCSNGDLLRLGVTRGSRLAR